MCDGSDCSAGSHDARADGKTERDGGASSDGGSSTSFDPTVASNLAYTSQFLYTGANPLQAGVKAGTIDLTRASVIRGQVLVHSTAADATNGLAPIEGVEVSVVGHPEYGATKTQSDGWYSMVVNGGGLLVAAYASTGYLPMQRRAVTRWLEYAITSPAVLTGIPSPTSSTVKGDASDARGHMPHKRSRRASCTTTSCALQPSSTTPGTSFRLSSTARSRTCRTR